MSKEFNEIWTILRNISVKFDEGLEKSRQEAEQRNKEFDERMKKLSEQVGGISNNNGTVVEEFFWNALKNKKELNGVKIDYSDKNIHRKKGSVEDEFDILLWNGNSVIIVETKYKVHLNDINKLKEKKISNFKLLFPDKQTQKVYVAIAGWSIPDKVKEQAREAGFFILSQAGDNLLIESDHLQAY